MHLASRHESYRQIRKGSDAQAPAPLDLPRIYVEAYIRKAREDTFKRNCGLRPRQLESRQKCTPVPKERWGFGWRLMSKL